MSKSKARKSTAFKPALKQIPENNYHDESDPFFMDEIAREQDRLYKEKQKELREYRKQQLIRRQKLRAREEAKIQARIKSATEFETRHKRAKEHEALLARERELTAEEKHFEEKVKPKAKKIVYNMKKALDRRPKYSCDVIFFREIEEGDNSKYKSTIKHDGIKYRQIHSDLASVKGNILPFNNNRTFRKESTEIWRQLIHILQTDPAIKRVIEVLSMSSQIDCIVVKGAVEIDDRYVKPYKPLKQKLFNSLAAQAICRKDISYDINKQAIKFSELFGIHLDQYNR